jgi:inosine/xanthosine triphosphate pyrophosphatase family protein
MAELPQEIKNKISHRGKASREACRILEKIAEKVET